MERREGDLELQEPRREVRPARWGPPGGADDAAAQRARCRFDGGAQGLGAARVTVEAHDAAAGRRWWRFWV